MDDRRSRNQYRSPRARSRVRPTGPRRGRRAVGGGLAPGRTEGLPVRGRPGGRGRRDRPRHRRRRVLLHARPVRLGQDHRAADDRRLRAARPPASILLDGVDVTALAPFQRDVNTVFQDYALFPHMSVAAQRRLRPAGAQGAPGPSGAAGPRRRWRRSGWPASATAGRRSSPAASGSGSRWPGRWSTGRRCCCSTSRSARSTCKLREEMQVELKAIQREVGITFVFVTHDQERGADDERPDRGLRRRPDRAGRRAGGDLRAARPPPFVAGFVGTSNLLDRRGRAGAPRPRTAPVRVRPEKIRVVRPARAGRPGRRARRDGMVAEVVYAGAETRLHRRPRRRRPGWSRPRPNLPTAGLDVALAAHRVRLVWHREHAFRLPIPAPDRLRDEDAARR